MHQTLSKAKGNKMKNIKAYDKFLRGMECFFRVNRQDNTKARILLEQSIKIDETSAIPFAIIGWTHLFDFHFSWSKSPLDSFEAPSSPPHSRL